MTNQTVRGKKWGMGLAVAGAIVALGLGAHIRAQVADHAEDHAALRSIKTAYEQAMNNGNFDGLMPFLAGDLSATMATGEKVKSPKEFRAYFAKMKNLMQIGNGGSYSIKLSPFATDFPTDGSAVSFGTTDETIQLPNGQPKSYHSYWITTARKEGVTWKLTGGRMVVDPHNEIFSAKEIAEISALSQDAGKNRGQAAPKKG